MPDEDIEFGDITPDDAYSAGDENINWDHVEEVEAQIKEINDIADADVRLGAAEAWAEKLEGGG